MVINKERLMQNTKARKKSCLTTICNSRQWFWPMDKLLRCRLAFYFPVYQFLITKYLFLITKWRFQALLVVHPTVHSSLTTHSSIPNESRYCSQWDKIRSPVHPGRLPSAPTCGHTAEMLPVTASSAPMPSCLWFSIKVKQHRNSYPGFQNCDIHAKTLQLASCCQPRHTRTNDDHLPSLLG